MKKYFRLSKMTFAKRFFWAVIIGSILLIAPAVHAINAKFFRLDAGGGLQGGGKFELAEPLVSSGTFFLWR
ncbi:MAG: hypothetical protein HON76_10430 [Candidatus Scalindua sp.]|jgi:hypothetical protein|nr:hypothetical protein [Candidatus Scalindua sp.]MBT5304362.1 hypothetical protein [Candidatus Scalindua sp.]MBT6051815.1 hypothetical protein [Candidatus Scalindua sp.]MBT6228160.1 hypothetical protein [Candidatus Scalindua sp.]MBT6562929.1 hypothetical protein [Candidatus Scalindua sp.]